MYLHVFFSGGGNYQKIGKISVHCTIIIAAGSDVLYEISKKFAKLRSMPIKIVAKNNGFGRTLAEIWEHPSKTRKKKDRLF